MHELSIAQSVVDTVLRKAREDGHSRVVEIGLRIGALTDIVPDALQFGFEVAVKDTPLQNSRLNIESVPIQASCRTCGHNFVVEQFVFSCQKCGSRDISMTSGDELEIAYIEVDNDPSESSSGASG